MKKFTFITVVALLAALLATPAMASGVLADEAERADWRVAGVWIYTAEIPETQIEDNLLYSSKQSGKFVMHTKYDEEKGKEFCEYILDSFDASYTLNGKTYDMGHKVNKKEFETPVEYVPGKPTYHETTGTAPSGVEYKDVYICTQVSENEIHGVVELYIKKNGNYKLVAVGTMKATHPNWKLAGTWDYMKTVPKQTLEIGGQTVEISAEEAGVRSVTTQSGALAGKEYFDKVSISYTATYTINGEKIGPISGKDEYDKGKGDVYNVGDVFIFEGKGKIGEIPCLSRQESYQVEENKIIGKIYISFDNGATWKEVGSAESTRSASSSSGGCNAGATAAMLLFCAVPAILRKKH